MKNNYLSNHALRNRLVGFSHEINVIDSVLLNIKEKEKLNAYSNLYAVGKTNEYTVSYLLAKRFYDYKNISENLNWNFYSPSLKGIKKLLSRRKLTFHNTQEIFFFTLKYGHHSSVILLMNVIINELFYDDSFLSTTDKTIIEILDQSFCSIIQQYFLIKNTVEILNKERVAHLESFSPLAPNVIKFHVNPEKIRLEKDNFDNYSILDNGNQFQSYSLLDAYIYNLYESFFRSNNINSDIYQQLDDIVFILENEGGYFGDLQKNQLRSIYPYLNDENKNKTLSILHR